MTLSVVELGTIQYHGTNHYTVSKLLPNYESLSEWYDSIPNNQLKDLVKLLSPLDRKNYFSFTNFPYWYSELCSKIELDTTIKIFGMNNSEINEVSLNLLSSLILENLTEHSMQQLVQHIMKRKLNTTLDNLLKCLGANGDFSEHTLLSLNVEMSEYKRWQSLGLNECPNPQELEEIFGG